MALKNIVKTYIEECIEENYPYFKINPVDHLQTCLKLVDNFPENPCTCGREAFRDVAILKSENKKLILENRRLRKLIEDLK